MGKCNIIYLAPDIDISKNEWGKTHVLWEVKYLQNYFWKVLLITKNSKNLKLWNNYKNVKLLKIPTFLHQPFFRIWLENLVFIFYAIILRLCWYSKIIERSYRLGWLFSIIFCSIWWKWIYQLNEPIYYEPYIMPIQKFLIRIMGHLNIKFFGTHENFSYNLPKWKYINWWWWCDLDIINDKNICNKVYDVVYVWSVAKWHSLWNILSIIKNHSEWSFLFITSWHNKELCNKKKQNNLNNLTILENIENKEIYSYIYQSKIWLALYEKNSESLKKFDYYYSPIKVHEYKACWLPVIASDIWNLINLVGNSWILVDNSLNQIESWIEKLLKDNELYDKLSKNAIKEIIEKYNWDYICCWYQKILN